MKAGLFFSLLILPLYPIFASSKRQRTSDQFRGEVKPLINFSLLISPEASSFAISKLTKAGAHQSKNCKEDMMTIYFYGSNREIVAENVKKCYSMIEKYGFNAAMGKIKLVGSEDLTGEKLLKVSIVPKSNAKPLSIDNWMLNTEEVTDATERAAAKAPVDGQHRMIAMFILEVEGYIDFNEEEMTETIKKPENMSLALFTASINNGRPWNYKDFSKSKFQTGDERIDYIEAQIQETGLKSDVIYSFYTLGQPEVKANVAKDLKLGINRLPKSLKLNATTQELGDKVLKAFKSSKISESTYDNGRLAKGFKLFYNEYKPEISQLQQLIAMISKDVWFGSQKPDGSAEAKQYYKNFEKWFQYMNESNNKSVETA